MTTLNREEHPPLSAILGRAGQLCGLGQGNRHQYPQNQRIQIWQPLYYKINPYRTKQMQNSIDGTKMSFAYILSRNKI